MPSNHHYNKKLKPFARKMRNNSTATEIRLWCELLRNKQMMGYPFLRQRPILEYIADFFCKELSLIIEVDGLTHQWEETVIKDQIKENELKAAAYNVLRFRDIEIMDDIENVRRTLENFIFEFEGR